MNSTPLSDAALSDASKLKLLADHVPVLIAYFRTDDIVCDFCNVAYAATYGLTPETAIGRKVPDIIGEEAFAAILPYVERAKRGERVSYQRPIIAPTGQSRMIEVTLIPHVASGNPPDKPHAAFVMINDITKFHEVEAAMRHSEERLKKFAEASTEGIVFHDNGVVVDANDAVCRLVKITVEQMVGSNVFSYVAQDCREAVIANVRANFERPHEGAVVRADGVRVPVEFVGRDIVYQGRTIRMTVVRDISDRKEAEARIQFLAHHDTLTHLPNRALLMDRLQVMLLAARRMASQIAVVFIDLDNFKTVNDSLGHYAGDQLLKRVAKRLQSNLRASDLVGRLGGDEFLVVLTDLAEPEDAAPILDKLGAAISEPFSLEDQPLSVSGSMGVAIFPRDGDTPDTLIRNADAAMYAAKSHGRNNFQYFAPALNQSAFAALAMESGIRKAIRQLEFVLHYQPTVDARDQSVKTVEALIRWKHPELGLLGPDHFISIAEHRGLIMPIGRWVIEAAIAQARAWRDQGLNLAVAINISAIQFKQADLVDHLARTLAQTQLPGEAIELELTESVFMEDVATTTRMLTQLKALGIGIAVDDFGTGYSSLSFLKRYPIDKIKIDRTFVHDVPHDADDVAITEAIISLARSLSLDVVAEGVETGAQVTFLQERGCHLMQGYLISRPMAADDCYAWLKARQG
jgi:diguanylate cyclase (GGDEF)-like protein/PAS domain S-box-containing protein